VFRLEFILVLVEIHKRVLVASEQGLNQGLVHRVLETLEASSLTKLFCVLML
jgi:hypothetical protein